MLLYHSHAGTVALHATGWARRRRGGLLLHEGGGRQHTTHVDAWLWKLCWQQARPEVFELTACLLHGGVQLPLRAAVRQRG